MTPPSSTTGFLVHLFLPPPFETGALLLLTGARDGSLRLHEVVLWRHGVVVAGGGGGEGRSPLSASSPPAGPSAWGRDGYGIELRVVQELQPPSSAEDGGDRAEVLTALLKPYHHPRQQQLEWVAATGDAQGRLRFHAPNGSIIKVRCDIDVLSVCLPACLPAYLPRTEHPSHPSIVPLALSL